MSAESIRVEDIVSILMEDNKIIIIKKDKSEKVETFKNQRHFLNRYKKIHKILKGEINSEYI